LLLARYPPEEKLSDRQYVVLVLRLLVDARGSIVYGDVGGPVAAEPAEERWVHFKDRSELLEAVERWLSSASRDPP
jgi:hypothetical protein